MNKKNKFITAWATWFIAPEDYAYVGVVIDLDEDECRGRHKKKMKDPDWKGYKFIHVPIAIPVPDEVIDKII